MKYNKGRKAFILLTIIMMLFVTSCNDTKQAFNELSPEEAAQVENLVAPDNTVLLGINVSNQPFLVIKKIIVDENARIANESFSIVGKNNTYEVKYSDIGYTLVEADIVNNIKSATGENLSYTYDEQKLNDILDGIRKNENVEAKETSIKMEGGKLVTTNGTTGSLIDETKLSENIKAVLSLSSNTFDLTFNESAPKYSEADFKDFTLIGSYSTKYNTKSTARNKNLQQACNKINNVVVYPGEVFSTNDHYGPTTVENGYAISNVIVNNELVEGVGGGVCQISSTLYNAVLRAELEVVERRNHSLAVSYAPAGFDATLANPYIDFKFKNGQDTPVLVVAGISNGVATVSIYGKEIHQAGRTLDFRSVLISTNKATMKKEDDDTLKEGTEKVEKKAVDGKTVKAYKDVYQDGKLVETVLLNTSTYNKVDGVTKVGTKKETKTTKKKNSKATSKTKDTSEDSSTTTESTSGDTQEADPATETPTQN